MLMTYYTDSILHDKGTKPLPHFEHRLHTFAIQYKIGVQANIETVCLLSKKSWFSAVCGILRKENECVFSDLLNEIFEYWNSGVEQDSAE